MKKKFKNENYCLYIEWGHQWPWRREFQARFESWSQIAEVYERNTWVLSCFSHVWLFVTLWTVAHQAPLSMEFSRWEYWSGLAFPDPGIEPRSLQLQADSFLSEPPGKPQGLDTQPLSSAYLHEELMFCFWLMKISTWILLFSKEYADSPFHT